MPILPSARQKTRGTRSGNRSGDDAKRSLVHTFAAFTQAADSLEKSYGQLQTEVARLSGELERANSELTSSLDENNLVFSSAARLCVINPEARRDSNRA